MIDYVKKTISLRGKSYPIEEFGIWWQGPTGLFTELDEAIDACKKLDLEPNLTIRPCAVALAESGNIYEPLL